MVSRRCSSLTSTSLREVGLIEGKHGALPQTPPGAEPLDLMTLGPLALPCFGGSNSARVGIGTQIFLRAIPPGRILLLLLPYRNKMSAAGRGGTPPRFCGRAGVRRAGTGIRGEGARKARMMGAGCCAGGRGGIVGGADGARAWFAGVGCRDVRCQVVWCLADVARDGPGAQGGAAAGAAMVSPAMVSAAARRPSVKAMTRSIRTRMSRPMAAASGAWTESCATCAATLARSSASVGEMAGAAMGAWVGVADI